MSSLLFDMLSYGFVVSLSIPSSGVIFVTLCVVLLYLSTMSGKYDIQSPPTDDTRFSIISFIVLIERSTKLGDVLVCKCFIS